MKKIYFVISVLYFHSVSAQQFQKVWDANEQTFIGKPGEFTNLGSRLFMFSLNKVFFNGIYSTNGTDTGTYLLNPGTFGNLAINPRKPSSEQWRLQANNGKVCFPSDNANNQACLSVSDGTPAGTKNIVVLDSNNYTLEIQDINVCNDKFWFLADTSSFPDLWVSDGTAIGTHVAINLYNGVFPEYAVGCFNGEVAYSDNDHTNGPQAWMTDSTGTTRRMISNILPNGYVGGISPKTYFEFNGKLYFDGNEGPSSVYSSDGTTNSAVPLLSSTSTAIPGNGTETFFYSYNNKMYFLAGNQSHHTALWVSDGTNAGTMPLMSSSTADFFPSYGNTYIAPYPDALFAPLGDKVIFGGNDGTHGYEVFITDGTPNGTTLLKDINPNGNSNAQLFTAYNGKVYFIATTDSTTPDYELWGTDGTTNGTAKLTNPEATHTNAFANTAAMIAFDDNLYFNAHFDTSGDILYKFNAPVYTGIENVQPQVNFSIWPNPAKDNVEVRLDNPGGNQVQVQVFDITGQLVESVTTNGAQTSTINLKSLTAGVYLIKVIFDNHIISGVKKLVKT